MSSSGHTAFPSASGPIAFGVHLERVVPRYTSYPTVASFREEVGDAEKQAWLRVLPAAAALDVTVHVPFCERICWFCMARTQASRSPEIVEAYLDALVAEIAQVGASLPPGASVRRMAWRGGSPASLPPREIARLRAALDAHLPLARDLDFAVEIDPAAVSEAALDALAAAGATEAIVGVQDGAAAVGRAIGRIHDAERFSAGIAALRARRIGRIAVDHVYGLPHQTAETVETTARAVAALAPVRVALTGYAHVPAIAKRQRMIREEALPDVRSRLAQFEAASDVYRQAGYRSVGIDHFVLPGDPLLEAAAGGRLRRGIDGYCGEPLAARLGFGAGALSCFGQGYVQNVAATRDYCAVVARSGSAAARGIALTLDDRVRARAIDMLMCGFRLDLAAVRAEFGDFAALLEHDCARAVETYRDKVTRAGDVLAIVADRPVMARLVARLFDARTPPVGPFALAV